MQAQKRGEKLPFKEREQNDDEDVINPAPIF